MALSAGIEDRIQKLFDEKYKGYAAHDRTLSALAAFRFVLEFIPEINQETVFWSFRARVCPRGSESNPRTPDGLSQKATDRAPGRREENEVPPLP
jgi:hypothetical protein